MSSVILTPAQGFDLTTLSELKREFDIRVDTDDIYWSRQIVRASRNVVSYCRREFARQVYKDTFYSHWRWSGHLVSRIELAHWPIVSIDALDLNSVSLIEDTDFSVDYEAGRIFRHVHWDPGTIEVTYTAGWILPGWAPDSLGGDLLPADVEQATIQTVTANRQAGRLSYTDRDPFLRSQTVEGVGSLVYSQTAIGSSTGMVRAIPDSARDLLARYMVPVGTP